MATNMGSVMTSMRHSKILSTGILSLPIIEFTTSKKAKPIRKRQTKQVVKDDAKVQEFFSFHDLTHRDKY